MGKRSDKYDVHDMDSLRAFYGTQMGPACDLVSDKAVKLIEEIRPRIKKGDKKVILTPDEFKRCMKLIGDLLELAGAMGDGLDIMSVIIMGKQR